MKKTLHIFLFLKISIIFKEKRHLKSVKFSSVWVINIVKLLQINFLKKNSFYIMFYIPS